MNQYVHQHMSPQYKQTLVNSMIMAQGIPEESGVEISQLIEILNLIIDLIGCHELTRVINPHTKFLPPSSCSWCAFTCKHYHM